MSESGSVTSVTKDGIATITFEHPRANSLPGALLRSIAAEIDSAGQDSAARVILLRSAGEKVFCSGASFDEMKSLATLEQSREFFSGFARVIMAMRRAPKFVVCRVQGKVAGGGVGVAAAADYTLAAASAAARLSELAIGIGPFIIGPAVERKIGKAAFNEMAVSADWRDARWMEARGLYAGVCESVPALDSAIAETTAKLAGYSPEAMARLKAVLWEGTENWEELLAERVGFTSKLALGEFVQQAIRQQ